MNWPVVIPPSATELDAEGSVVAKDGRLLCSVGLVATLFIEQGDRPEVRDGIRQAYKRYLALLGKPLRWCANPDTGDPEDLTQSSLGDLDAWDPQIWQRFDVRIMMHGGNTPDDAPPARFLAISREIEEDELSVVSWSLPLSFSHKYPASTFVDAVLELCELVKPVHGYAGLGVSPHFTGLDVESGPAVQALLHRYAGLIRDMPEDDAVLLSGRDAIAGINWLTMLSSDYLARHGGEAQLFQRLGGAATGYRYSSGLVLQAGPYPRWIEASESAPEYEALRRALADLIYA